MNQNELREFAESEGGAFGECDPADPRWSWREEAFDVARVVGGSLAGRPMDREAWLRWLNEEISAGIRGGGAYVDRLATALRETPDAFEPVIVAVHSDGRIEVGDGWHRFAISVRDGIATLKAVVGTWNAKTGQSADWPNSATTPETVIACGLLAVRTLRGAVAS